MVAALVILEVVRSEKAEVEVGGDCQSRGLEGCRKLTIIMQSCLG